MKITRSDYLLLLCRVIVGGIFIYAGLSKIVHPEEYAQAISNYKLLPYYLTNISAIVMPWLELIGGLFILCGFFLQGSCLIIGGLLSIFILAVASALFRGLDISCGCFHTSGGEKVGFSLILRNLILLVLTYYVMTLEGGRVTIDYIRKRNK